MTNDSSIKYISDLLDHPETITDGDHGSIMLYRQTFPYFIPARYMEALELHKEKRFSPEMLSGILPYTGNWMMFCDFLEAGTSVNNRKPIIDSSAKPLPEKEITPAEVQKVTSKKKAIEYSEQRTVVNEKSTASDATNKVVENIPIKEPLKETQPKPEAPSVTPVKVPANATDKITDNTLQATVAVPIKNTVLPEATAATAIPIEKPVAPVQEKTSVAMPEAIATPAATIPAEKETTPPAMEKVSPVAVNVEEPVVVVPAEKVAAPVAPAPEKDENLILPLYTGDYFLQQGEKISENIPAEITDLKNANDLSEKAKSLMVMMSFSEWLLHFKNTSAKQQEEKKEQKALRSMWQKEKLAAAIEEENEEIPENVFEMAVNSIAKEDGLASESLADIYIKQGKYDKAIDMYRKLSLRNPQKSTYFARKIEEVLKEKQS